MYRFLLCLAIAGSAAAADAQVEAPDRQILSPPQGSRDVVQPQIGTRENAAAAERQGVSQVGSLRETSPDSSERSVGAVPAQVTTERRRTLRTTQLSDGRATADASAPLSRPADGRTLATARVGGSDRCDPSADKAAVPVCTRVIEMRSRDFARPDPLTLSPEQRLLVDQRVRAGQPGGSPFAPRPDDAEQADPATLRGQTVAAIARRGENEAVGAAASAAAGTGLPAGVSPEALVVIDAILNQPAPR